MPLVESGRSDKADENRKMVWRQPLWRRLRTIFLTLQETSLKALDNEDKYIPDTNFKGWMYTIMRNIFINNYRKVVRDQTFVDQTDNLYHLSLPQDSGFDSTEGAYDIKEIHRIMNALPKGYKIPFAMHVSGFKYREIADKLNLPLGTVKSRIFFTRQRLQEQLRDFVE